MGDERGEKRSKLAKASRILEQKVKRNQDYRVIGGSEESSLFPRSLIANAWIYESEYNRALQLEERLIREFEGKPLRKALPGDVVSNEYGESYRIAGECFTQFNKPDYEKSRQALISDLKLVYGIGSVRENELKERGYHTIEELMKHAKWKERAGEVLGMIENNDIQVLQRWMGRFLPKSHPLVHYLAGLLREEDFMLLDIETLGLFGRAIILLGVARPKKNAVCINQYLLRDIPDEPSALWEFVSHLEEKSALITFNGRTFDVPSIQERLNFYNMEASITNPHFDLLHFSRRAWRDELPDCRLETLEKNLGIHRDMDIPSALVPGFYETYLKTRNVGPLFAIVEHNKQDLLTLATLFSKLYEAWDI